MCKKCVRIDKDWKREPRRMKWVIFQNILIVVVLPQQYNKVLNKRETHRQWL